MNVTLKIPDELCRKARHRAVDANKSLSGWVADILERELNENTGKYPSESKSLVDLLGHSPTAERDFELPERAHGNHRLISFP